MKKIIVVAALSLFITISCSQRIKKELALIEPDTAQIEAEAKDTIPQIPLEDMVGQMIMVGFSGTTKNCQGVKQVAEYIAKGKVGGVLLLGHNIVDSSQLAQLNEFLHLHNKHSFIPLLISVDQEGGKVERLTAQKGFIGFPSAKKIAEKNDFEYAKKIWRKMAIELKSVGINLNLAPVADVDIYPNSPAIGKMRRSFSQDENIVFQYCSLFVSVFREVGVLTSIKPGHGSASEDSHKGFTDITSTWQQQELSPYKKLNDANLIDMVMTAHVFHSKFDSIYPATLSENMITGILRNQIGFNSVVITDDLQMGAIEQHFSFENAIIKSVNAGCDILLSSGFFNQTPEMPKIMHDIVMRAIENEKISKERIYESWKRIYLLKKSLIPP